MTDQQHHDTSQGEQESTVTVRVDENDIIPFNAILDCVMALHREQDVEEVIKSVPADRADELFVYALSMTYGAIKLACTLLDVSFESFLAERNKWFWTDEVPE